MVNAAFMSLLCWIIDKGSAGNHPADGQTEADGFRTLRVGRDRRQQENLELWESAEMVDE